MGNTDETKTESLTETECAAQDSSSVQSMQEDASDVITLNIVYKKQKHQVQVALSATVEELKKLLQPLIEVPPSMQKVMIKGLARDDRTLRELGVTSGAKVMVVGSTLNEILSVARPDARGSKDEAKAEAPAKEKLCEMKQHKKVLEKGKPDDVMPGKKNVNEPLPPTPLSGMLNRNGGKVRLTFKLEFDQLWIGTKERTEKVAMTSVKQVVSEPITDHDEYHIMGVQLGPTEASRYWVYWVPAQYVTAIKDTVLGKWQYF